MSIIIFQLAILIFSVIVHEVAHGVVAGWLGDDTAYRAGRITLNPVKHIDVFGSIILPLVLAIPALFGAQPIIVGWAKPVPYDPRFLPHPRRDAGLIAAAGPASNVLLAFVFAVFLRIVGAGSLLAEAFTVIIVINLMLAVFNSIPIPPLDGSKMAAALAGKSGEEAMGALERHGFLIIVLFLVFGIELVQVAVVALYRALLMLVGVM
jgi:Zn-dependent protease